MARTKRRKLFVPKAASRPARAGLKRAGRMAAEYATPKLKAYLDDRIANVSIGEIGSILQDTADKMKSPVGSEGKNLNKDKKQLINGTAVGDTTESTCVFFYRPKKTRKTEDTIYYESIRNKRYAVTTGSGEQAIADRNLALLEPPSGDTLPSDGSYTNFSIRNEFDRMLRARAVDTVVGEQTLPKQSLVANFHQLQSTMIITGPAEGGIIEIYDLQPKFAIGPGTYVDEAAADDHISPRWCMYNGLDPTVDSNVMSMYSYSPTVVGVDPEESVNFRRTYNVIKKTTVRMTKNAIHRHRLVFGINKSVTWDEMAQASSSGGTAPWLPTQMIIMRGYPSSTTAATAVSFNIQQESKLKYSSRLGLTTNVIVYNEKT